MAGDPHRHTKSEGLKRLLRRRGRRTKTGANSGEKVYSWAEYGQVNFTPSGHRSWAGRIIVGGLFAVWFVGLPVLAFVDQSFPNSYDTVLFWLIIVGGTITAVTFILGLLIFVYSSARTVSDLLVEHRNRKAARTAAAQDADANRAR